MRAHAKQAPVQGVISLISATFLYTWVGVLARVVGDTIPVFYQSALRDFFSSLVLLVPLIFFKKWRSIQKKDLGWIIFRSVTGIFGFALYYIAINNIPMGTTYFLSYAGMLFGSFLFGKFFMKGIITFFSSSPISPFSPA